MVETPSKTPIVTSFCGCINLKIACLVIAWIRMFVAFCVLVILMSLGFDFENTSNEVAFKLVFRIAVIILCVYTIINYCSSYMYIRGHKSEKLLYLKCHIIMQAIDCVLLLLTINVYCFLFSVIDCYFLICSISLHQQCEKSSQENSLNSSENTVIKFDNIPLSPPQCSSCENDAQVQSDTTANTGPKNYKTENTVIEFEKVPSLSTLKNSCENGAGNQNDKVQNTVIESEKSPSPQLYNTCENEMEP